MQIEYANFVRRGGILTSINPQLSCSNCWSPLVCTTIFPLFRRTWGCLRSNWSRAAKAKGGAVLVASLCGTLLHFLVESDGQGYRHGKPLSMAGKSSVNGVLKGGSSIKWSTIYYTRIYIYIYTIWLFNSSPWKITILKFGKPSISMGHLYHGYVTHNQRV